MRDYYAVWFSCKSDKPFCYTSAVEQENTAGQYPSVKSDIAGYIHLWFLVDVLDGNQIDLVLFSPVDDLWRFVANGFAWVIESTTVVGGHIELSRDRVFCF